MSDVDKKENQELDQEIEILDDADSNEDERLSDSLNDESDARREAKRAERRKRKEMQRYARDKNKEELQLLIEQNKILQQRLEAVENHALNAQKGSLDQNYQNALYSVKAAEQALAKAIELGDGSRVPDLLRQRDQALARAAEINRMKQGFNVRKPQPVQQVSEVTERAKKWASKNPWFNANSTDPDSVVAKALDASLIAEGLDPSTKKYWKELDRRLSERIPHRFAEDENSGYSNDKPGRRGPPVGGGREISAPGSKKVLVSPERVNAMKEAGYWDDPVLRQRMLKRYQQVDRELKSAR